VRSSVLQALSLGILGWTSVHLLWGRGCEDWRLDRSRLTAQDSRAREPKMGRSRHRRRAIPAGCQGQCRGTLTDDRPRTHRYFNQPSRAEEYSTFSRFRVALLDAMLCPTWEPGDVMQRAPLRTRQFSASGWSPWDETSFSRGSAGENQTSGRCFCISGRIVAADHSLRRRLQTWTAC
jgi:hypothetical protein